LVVKIGKTDHLRFDQKAKKEEDKSDGRQRENEDDFTSQMTSFPFCL
jgi:hypothetical protein